MDGSSVGTATLNKALDQGALGASLITGTLDRLNTGMKGLTPAVNPDYAMQKAVLSSAYADMGIGTRLDTSV